MALTDMSFREKSAWAMLILLSLTGAFYAWETAGNWTALGKAPPPSLKIALVYVFFVVVGSIVAQSVLGASSPKEANAPADERERSILHKAGNLSGWIVSIFAVAAVLHYYAHRDGDVMFHVVVAGLMIGSIVEYALQIYFLRRGV